MHFHNRYNDLTLATHSSPNITTLSFSICQFVSPAYPATYFSHIVLRSNYSPLHEISIANPHFNRYTFLPCTAALSPQFTAVRSTFSSDTPYVGSHISYIWTNLQIHYTRFTRQKLAVFVCFPLSFYIIRNKTKNVLIWLKMHLFSAKVRYNYRFFPQKIPCRRQHEILSE